jgi:probable nitrogen fixation protein
MSGPVPLPEVPPARTEPLPPLPDSAFLTTLVRQIRAHDLNNVWEAKSDAELLEPYVLTREQRRKIPIIADPDRRVVWRLEQFYSALGLAIEQRTQIIAQPMLKLSHEGYGRVVLIAGRLVVVSRNLRDVHRYGYATFEDLAADGETLVNAAVAIIEQYPDVART